MKEIITEKAKKVLHPYLLEKYGEDYKLGLLIEGVHIVVFDVFDERQNMGILTPLTGYPTYQYMDLNTQKIDVEFGDLVWDVRKNVSKKLKELGYGNDDLFFSNLKIIEEEEEYYRKEKEKEYENGFIKPWSIRIIDEFKLMMKR